MAWIEKRGSRFLVRWHEPDGKVASKAFGDRRAAREHKAEVEGELLRGGYTPQELRRQTFETYARETLSSALRLKDSTRYGYQTTTEKHLIPLMGQVPIGSVDERVVRRVFNQIEGGPFVLDKVRRVLSRILTQAYREGLIPRNPIHAVEVPRLQRREIRVLSPEEVQALAEAIRPRYRAAVLLAAWGGLRIGEIGALKVEDLDRERGVLHVRRALSSAGGTVRVTEPKSKSSRRTVALPAFVMTELARHQLEHPHPEGWLFRTGRGQGWLTNATMHPIWKEACEAADITCRFHDLRHTAVALAIRQGAHPKAIQARLGHASITMTLDTYGHLFPGMDEDIARGLEDFEPRQGKVASL